MTLKNKLIYTTGIIFLLLLAYLFSGTNEKAFARKQLDLYNKQIQVLESDIKQVTTQAQENIKKIQDDAQKTIDQLQKQIEEINKKTSSYENILSIPKADASWFDNELSFGDKIEVPEISFKDYLPEFKILQWNNAPEWKNERLKQIQIDLYANGFNQEEVKALVMMAIQESGLNFHTKGDSGCSEGIWQRNKCVHGKNPYNFDTVEGNIAYITPRMRTFFNKYNIDRAIIAHNSSRKAANNEFSKYLWEVKRHEVNLYSIDL
jgi:hypothetical protein